MVGLHLVEQEGSWLAPVADGVNFACTNLLFEASQNYLLYQETEFGPELYAHSVHKFARKHEELDLLTLAKSYKIPQSRRPISVIAYCA